MRALSLFACFCLSILWVCAARAQEPAEQKLIEELVRKAELKEKEDGFCANTSWGPIDLPRFTVFLVTAKEGTWKVNKFAANTCEYNLVTRVHYENGGKCVTYSYWQCKGDTGCSKGGQIDCLNSAGVFVKRHDVK